MCDSHLHEAVEKRFGPPRFCPAARPQNISCGLPASQRLPAPRRGVAFGVQRAVPDTASSRNTRSCLLGPQRRNGEPAPHRRHRMWGSVTSVLTCPLFSPLVLTLPPTHTHTHKHKEKVSGAPPSTIQAFGRTEHTGKSDGSTAARLFSTVNAGTKLGGSQGQAQKAATRVFRGGEMFENSDPSDHPCHLCWNGRRWLPS